MQTPRRTTRAILGIAAAALLVGGCAAGDDAARTESGAVAPEPEEEALDADGGEADAARRDGGDAEQAAAEPGADEAPGSAGTVSLNIGAAAGREVIRRASLELAVDDPDAAVSDITSAVERAGGFVESADLSRGDGEQLLGTLRLRIPVEQLGVTLTRLEDVAAEVRSKHLSSEDVTGEVVDLEAQLRNLRAAEQELRGLLTEVRDSSGSADQVLAVFERLRGIRAEIERLEGRRATLADLVALATVDVHLVATDEVATVTEDDDPWSPGAVAREALQATADAFEAVATGAIWVGLTAMPLLAVTAGPLLLVWWLVRRRSGGPATPAA